MKRARISNPSLKALLQRLVAYPATGKFHSLQMYYAVFMKPQQRRRRRRKRQIRAASNFIALIPSRSIRQMLEIFLELNSKQLYRSSGREKKSRSPQNVKLGIFHAVVVQ